VIKSFFSFQNRGFEDPWTKGFGQCYKLFKNRVQYTRKKKIVS